MNEKILSDPARTFTRSQGCWNCKHFENQELARKVWTDQLFKDPTLYEDPLTMRTLSRGAEQFEQNIRVGGVGICLVGGSEQLFIHFKYLCGKWDGKSGALTGRSFGEALDPLPEELHDRIGDTVTTPDEEE